MATFTEITETPSPPPSSTTCTHYKRKCLLIAPCCGEPHSCRFCHDAVHVDDWKLDPEQTHPMNRHDVTEIICVECHTRQPATNACTTCDIPFAAYYCAICQKQLNGPKPYGAHMTSKAHKEEVEIAKDYEQMS